VWLVHTLKPCADCGDVLSDASSEATYFVIKVKKHWAASKFSTDVVRGSRTPGGAGEGPVLPAPKLSVLARTIT
jgi:hypothetical protein